MGLTSLLRGAAYQQVSLSLLYGGLEEILRRTSGTPYRDWGGRSMGIEESKMLVVDNSG
jgi:hypothetical protein